MLRPGGQEPQDAGAVAADGVVGDGGARFAEGADPGLGQAPQNVGIALLQGGQGGPAPLAASHARPGLGPLIARTYIRYKRLALCCVCPLSHDVTPRL